MKTKELAGTGKDVSIVGLGTAFVGRRPEDAGKIAGDFEIDRDLAVSTIAAGIDSGITLLDTAPYYGTESVVGEAVHASGRDRSEFGIMTKAGRAGLDEFDYSRDGVLRSVENSLSTLGVSYLDVVSIHDANDVSVEYVMSKAGAFQALAELRAEGVIGGIGTATWDHRINAAYLATGEFQLAVCSSAYSLLNHAMRERILPEARKHGVSLIAAEPLERGLLALGVQPGREYAQRRFSPAVLEQVQQIDELAQARGLTLLEVSLQWLSREPLAVAAIPGPANAEEARSNAAAGAKDIPESFWTELEPLLNDWDLAELGINL